MFKIKKSSTSECVVPRSMGLALRISRVFGVAPVRFEHKPNGCLIRYAPGLCIYGYAFISAFSLITIIGEGINLSLPLEMMSQTAKTSRRVVRIANLLLVATLTVVVGYQAPAQIRRLIDFINQLQKMTPRLKNTKICLQFWDNRQYQYVVITLLSLFLLTIVDFSINYYSMIFQKRQIWIPAMLSTYYCSFIVTKLVEMQFILTAYYVLSVLKFINSKLRHIQKKYDQSTGCSVSTAPNDPIKYGFEDVTNKQYSTAYTISIQPRSINKTIDTLGILSDRLKDQTQKEFQTDAQTIRGLFVSYDAVCEIIKKLNQNYGIALLILLAAYLLHDINSLYYLITNIDSEPLEYKWDTIVIPLLQAAWCVFHTSCMIMLVEPCHRTHEELELTKELTRNLIHTMSLTNDSLLTDLKAFSGCFLFNQVAYSPLQVCTLTRSLVITILGNVTTYLVVIIQMK